MQKQIVDILKVLKDMSIKKIIVVFVCIYPIFTSIYFKDELKLMFTNTSTEVKVEDITGVIEQTLRIRDKYNCATVSVWLYQPDGDSKEYKERISYTGDQRNVFFELTEIKLLQHPKILFGLRNNKYIKVSKGNHYELSKLVKAYNVKEAYVIPIKNDFGLIIAELLLAFDEELSDEEINNIINSMEMIRLKNFI